MSKELTVPPCASPMTLSIPEHVAGWGRDMDLALNSAFSAGEVIRARFGAALDSQEKSRGDFVTQVDIECDGLITGLIKKNCPRDAILSEEGHPNTKEDGERLWVIDPLDGTAGFLAKNPEIPSVMIALREHFATQLAVVLFPLTGELLYAKRAFGAYKNGQRVLTSRLPSVLAEAEVAMNPYADPSRQTQIFLDLKAKLEVPGGAKKVTTISPHSGIVKSIVAGNLAAVVHDNGPDPLKQGPWDVIPAELIAQEAGGVLVNLGDGNRVNPFKPHPFMVAGNEEIANAIVALVNENKRRVA